VDVRGIDDPDALVAAEPQRRRELRHHCVRLLRLQLRALGDEVILHVDHDHRGLAGIDSIKAVRHGHLR
jgi:hypothetical protein